MPNDVMDIEADCFMVFQGWDAKTTEDMTLPELLLWHQKATQRQERINQQIQS
ncbi:GpE family phage tail protein [Spartinivicinus poritis]|uniref:GpE family phage tail protein n=1 Tax=Spartinivicinus poritis TaxID=2994640 RepID=A0ABT5UGL7_9GAMM|nr:GpE family phage tail protein [Spartinivicinus sp. A2-2]MDE1465532.1 GpE family phage tail protein [Spartinivicinus sp. A2-2]